MVGMTPRPSADGNRQQEPVVDPPPSATAIGPELLKDREGRLRDLDRRAWRRQRKRRQRARRPAQRSASASAFWFGVERMSAPSPPELLDFGRLRDRPATEDDAGSQPGKDEWLDRGHVVSTRAFGWRTGSGASGFCRRASSPALACGACSTRFHGPLFTRSRLRPVTRW